jgi:RNA polymerase sigma-70 factor (ECF subfamily)
VKIDWQVISRQYGPLVWRTAYRLVGTEADAADCFQETFICALDFSKRQEVHNWAGLLQRLATARSLDLLRKRKREMRSRVNEAEWDRVASGEIGPDRQAQDSELMESLRAAITKLPAQQGEIFCLRYLNGLSYEEIAEEIGTSVDSVGVSLHRAKSRLRELLVSACAEER